MKQKVAVAIVLAVVWAIGAFSLSSRAFPPGPPCPSDPNLQCLDYVDPVFCLKPGEGWRTYSNRCYAIKDCARFCRPVGS